MRLPLSRIAEFVSATGEFDHRAVAEGYSIDSRTIKPGELFFAVEGERLNGHDFVEQAIRQGAVAAVVRKDQLARYAVKTGLVAVDDTLLALQTLATAVRRLWGKPVVGVTGSVGKTTTKEAIAHLLSTRYRVLRSEGNLNNHFGLPLMLLKLQAEQEIAVIEMGMSHAGEIASLAEIAQPETGVVTAVAPVHLQFFNSVADIARAKYELIAALPADGTAILNADDEYVSQFGRDFKGKVVRYGLRAPAEIRAENIQSRSAVGCVFDLLVDTYRERAIVPLMGSHNVSNALAAVAVALQRGLTPSEAAAALATLKPADKRGQVLQLGNITVINDCYNSNPIALHAMVDTLAGTPGKRRIVVAGEMLELGESAEQLHREAGRYIAERKIDVLLGVRGWAQAMVAAAGEAGMRAEFVASAEDAGEWLAHEAADGDVILLKASRGVKLEKALDIWSLRKPGSRAGSERSANQNA